MQRDIPREIIELVSAAVRLPKKKVTENADLRKDLGIDSLTALEIVYAVENKYKITLPELRLSEISTVRDVIKLVSAMLQKDAS